MNNTKAIQPLSPTAAKAAKALALTLSTAGWDLPSGLRKHAEAWGEAIKAVRASGGDPYDLEEEDRSWHVWCEAVDRYGRTGTDFDPRIMVAQQDRLF